MSRWDQISIESRSATSAHRRIRRLPYRIGVHDLASAQQLSLASTFVPDETVHELPSYEAASFFWFGSPLSSRPMTTGQCKKFIGLQ